MVKKVLLGMMAFATLFATSCTNELDPVEMGNTSTVSFKVATPAIESRAYSDGATATVLQYAVYDAAGEELTDLTVTDGEIHGSATVNLQLTTGNTYSVIFWAAAPNAPYAVNFATKTMTVDYNGAKSNAENRDAFYKYYTFTVKGAQTETIELKRPFAQLNIGTNDFDESKSAGYTPTQSSVKVSNVYTTLNFVDGTVSNPSTITGDNTILFDLAAIPASYDATTQTGEKFPVAGYEYLAMNYLLVGADKETVDIEFTYADVNNDAKTRTVGSVPVQRNYRTNIYGQLLTSDVDINVEINPDYEKPDYEVVVWDGKTIKQPVYDATTLTYEISHPSELAYIAQLVNGTLDTDNLNRAAVAADNLKGKTVKLMCDIDLFNHEWTPIGNSSNIFKGTFDGQGHTIFNLVVRGGNNSNQGLFGVTHDGEIKNLVVENANVSGRLAVGVVAGTPYTSKYTDITVKGHVEVNGFAYVGGVGGRNAYADWTNITVDADETSYVKANSVENGTAYRTYVGGVVGFNGEGGHSFKNITSDINVNGSTIDVGGLFGIAHYGNNFENLTCTGDVEIYAAEEFAEAEEIGGIAGVWMDSNVAPVTFTNIKFEGNVTTNIARETVWYGNLIGKPYNNKGTGKLIIDGYEMLANGVGLKDGEYRVSTGAGFATAVTIAPANAKITLTADVDLTGVDYTPRSFSSLVFDGQNYTISGVKVENANQAALFGKTWKFDIQNVTLANSIFTGQNIDGEDSAGGFIAFLQTYSGGSQIVNCHVKNCTIGSAKYVGGIVAYKDGEKSIKIDNCSVKDSKLVSKYTENGTLYKGHIGGLVGYLCGDNATSTVTNCVVENNTFEVLGARGGLFIGSAQADYNVSGKVEGNTGLVQLCGEVNKITNWNNVACTYVVSTTNDLKTALSSGGNIVLGGDVDFEKIDLTTQTQDIVIDANGYTITTASNYGVEATAGKNITLKNAVVEITVNGDYLKYAAGFKISNGDYNNKTIKLENCEIRMANTDWAYAINMPASVKNLNLVIDNCTLEGAIALQCWGDNNTITVTNSNLICNYTTSALYTSYCVALQGDGTNKAENNTLNISGCTFSYSGVDNFNSKIYSVKDVSGVDTNNINVSDCTFNGVEAY